MNIYDELVARGLIAQVTDEDKIKDVIGKGGEMITKIILDASHVNSVNDINAVKVDLEDDGTVLIYHTNKEVIAKTKELIENITKEVEEGKEVLYTLDDEHVNKVFEIAIEHINHKN